MYQEINLQELVARVAGARRPLIAGLAWRPSQYLFQEVVANSHLLGKLLLLAVIAAVLNNIQQAFTEQEVGRVTLGVPGFAGHGVQTFTIAINTGRSCRKNGNMQALLRFIGTLNSGGGDSFCGCFSSPFTYDHQHLSDCH